MVSSVISPSQFLSKTASTSNEQPTTPIAEEASSAETDQVANSTICLTIFIFRGEPDVYYKRHVLLYFTSPAFSEFRETVHVQRIGPTGPWMVDRARGEIDWALEANYAGHVNAGAVVVEKGEEMVPVAVVAAVSVKGRDDDWNCQNFLLEGLQALVHEGYQTQEWYHAVEDELLDRLMDGTVG